VLPEIKGDGTMYTNYEVEETMMQTVEVTDVREIAKNIRGMIKNVPGATFSVTINRQWANTKIAPHNVIYVQGMVKFWGEDYSDKKQEQSNLMLQGILKDVAEEHQLNLIEGMYAMSYMLTQYL
jgi:hypothetical protein